MNKARQLDRFGAVHGPPYSAPDHSGRKAGPPALEGHEVEGTGAGGAATDYPRWARTSTHSPFELNRPRPLCARGTRAAFGSRDDDAAATSSVYARRVADEAHN